VTEEEDVAAAALVHLDALYSFAVHLSGNRRDADDLVQETYARAISAAATFVRGTNLRAWLFRILRNAYIDDRRKAKRSPIDAGDTDTAGPDADEPVCGDAELDRMRSLVAGDLAAALAELPEEARTAVLLDAEGLTESELAQVLGCAIGTVKSKLFRARAALRTRLRDYAR
jgi:RNA polymerase sigma-70 factor (ECF subfamily)